MKKNKNYLLVALAVAVVVSMVMLIIKIVFPYRLNPNQSNQVGYLQFVVYDAFTDTPIENAILVIPEINKEFHTNEMGATETITVPIIKDPRFPNNPKQWGESTVIFYHKDYIEYALFYLQVTPNQSRTGIKIYLFPKSENGSNQPFSIIEGPEKSWVNNMVDKYRPKS